MIYALIVVVCTVSSGAPCKVQVVEEGMTKIACEQARYARKDPRHKCVVRVPADRPVGK